MVKIAHIENDFPTKFGLPRQSLICGSLRSRIVFEPEYRRAEALRGLEGFSHLWVIWEFSEGHSNPSSRKKGWSPTVRPPRLGGNVRLGVFATRSPNRPSPIGLSCVKIQRILPNGDGIEISGADMMNGTAVLDIKPYLPSADSHPEASEGFVGQNPWTPVNVEFESGAREKLEAEIGRDKVETLLDVLRQDPRPACQREREKEYGISYAGRKILFRSCGDGTITVLK